jgi:hypothetical protein
LGCCENTHICKGSLESSNNIDCPICFEIKEFISYPKCNQSICIDCLKRFYYGENCEGEPIFPSSDIEDEYGNEEYLRKCSLCRK